MNRRKRTAALVALSATVFTCVFATSGIAASSDTPGDIQEDVPAALTDAVPNPATGRIQQAIELLLQTPKGRDLITLALKTWKLALPEDLLKVVQPSSVSRTDAVLTRHYNSATGKESRERQVTVYLRQDQSLDSMTLDLAHELVHATSRPAWDPYDPNLTAGTYIRNAIEGPGGEVQAVQMECSVALELGHIKTGALALHHCGSYMSMDKNGNAVPDAQKITQDFYRVGEWRPFLARALGSEIGLFPLLSEESPRLYSSTGNAPYPAALFREFRLLTQIACENSKRRATLSETSIKTRSVASAPQGAESSRFDQDSTFQFIERRCQ